MEKHETELMQKVALGRMIYVCGVNGPTYYIESKDDIIKSIYARTDIEDDVKKFHAEDVEDDLTTYVFNIIDGLEFLNMVEKGCIMNHYGLLSGIFIDGYQSNLGLCHEGFRQGEFMVDAELWKKICREHKVEVNWLNN